MLPVAAKTKGAKLVGLSGPFLRPVMRAVNAKMGAKYFWTFWSLFAPYFAAAKSKKGRKNQPAKTHRFNKKGFCALLCGQRRKTRAQNLSFLHKNEQLRVCEVPAS